MINGIYPAQYSTYNVQNKTVAMQPNVVQPSIPSNLQGLNAVGNYNSAMVQPFLNIAPALPTIMLPEALPALKGERVLNSEGKLHSIINKTQEYTSVTKMVPGKENCIKEIITRDNSGCIMREQFNSLKDDGTIRGIYINEYYPNSDKLKRYTVYEGGTPDFVEEYEYPTKDITIGKIHDYTEKKFIINEFNKSTGFMKTTVFDENKVLKSIMTSNLDGSGETVYYTNNIPSKVETRSKDMPIQNTTGKNPFEDKDLTPHPKVSLNYNPLDLQGEKTFYSNGVVETLKVKGGDKDCEYYYEPDGRLASMTEKYPDGSSMFVEFNDFWQSILEQYSDKKFKYTSWEQDGTYNVNYDENGVLKNFGIAFNSNEYFYREKSNDNHTLLVFNKNKELIRMEDLNNSQKTNPEFDKFKQILNDEKWENKIIGEVVWFKQKGLVDGVEYELSKDGTVKKVGTWQKTEIVVANNLEMQKLYENLYKKS